MTIKTISFKPVLVSLLLSAGLLSACGSSSDPSGISGGSGIALGESAPRVQVAADRAGTSYRQEIISPVTGDSVIVQVFEPRELKAGQTYPLVLQGHGYGGQRDVEPTNFQQRLIDAGYYVISIDERGFGESSGTVRVMDPDFEGQNLIAILDWAEDLEGLRRRSNGEMMVGSYGGSYGGMYQFLLAGADPKHRLRVLAPDITPHDLTYSLNPNGVIKSGWALFLSVGGEGLGGLFSIVGGNLPSLPTPRLGLHQDMAIYETLVQGAVTNNFTETGLNFFKYHSVAYFCDGEPAGPQTFLLATPDPLNVPPTPFPELDVLITQGMRDGLFNFNDGLANYECARARGGDVRFLTHESGHILPISLSSVPLPPDSNLETALDPFYTALTLPNFEDASGDRHCGSLVLDDVQFAWLEEKLSGKTGSVDAALSTGHDVCMSLGAEDAVAVREVKRGGTEYPIDASTPQFNSALGIAGALLGNGAREALLANQTLETVGAGGGVIAGVPLLTIDIEGLSGAEMTDCTVPLLPMACDPILFLAIGHRAAGQERWDAIDDQITPVRGFGPHTLEMNGIAERLSEGDELALLIYGFHAQFPISWSRDLLVPAVTVTGTIQLPLLNASEIVRDGV